MSLVTPPMELETMLQSTLMIPSDIEAFHLEAGWMLSPVADILENKTNVVPRT